MNLKKNKLAIIILNWNGTKDTIECLNSLVNSCYQNYKIYLLDNGSNIENKKELLEYLEKSSYKNCFKKYFSIDETLKEEKKLYYIDYNDNLGFANGNNYIVEKIVSLFDYILLLNNDTEIPDKTIGYLEEFIEKSNYIAITCDIRYFYDKSRLWNAGGKFTWYGDRKYYSQNYIEKMKKNHIKSFSADFITGCALLIKSVYIEKYGLFTDKFFHGEEDFNFCLRAKKNGYKMGVTLNCKIYHKVGRSLNPNENNNKSLNALTIHYSNRIIDYKGFLNKFMWLIWREMYLFLVFIKRNMTNLNISTSFKLVNRIRNITNINNTVNKEVFDKIMKYNWYL